MSNLEGIWTQLLLCRNKDVTSVSRHSRAPTLEGSDVLLWFGWDYTNTLVSIEACVCSVDGTGSDPSLPRDSATSSRVPSLCLRVQDMVLVGLDEVYLIDPSSLLLINFDFLWICEHILYLDILNSITDSVKAHSGVN